MYYKVTNSDQQSVILSDFRVQYSTDYWIHGLGKLFVFQNLGDARNFATNYIISRDNSLIWRCEVLNPERLLVMARNQRCYTKFWKSFPNSDVLMECTPPGTIVADAVKLLDRVC